MCLGESQCGIVCVLVKPCALRSPCIPEQPTESLEGLDDSLSSRFSQPQKGCGANRGEGPMYQCRGLTPASAALRLPLQVPRGASGTLHRQLPRRGGGRDLPGAGPRRRRRRDREGGDWNRRVLSDSPHIKLANPESARGWGRSRTFRTGPEQSEPVLATAHLAALTAFERCKCHSWLTRPPSWAAAGASRS